MDFHGYVSHNQMVHALKKWADQENLGFLRNQMESSMRIWPTTRVTTLQCINLPMICHLSTKYAKIRWQNMTKKWGNHQKNHKRQEWMRAWWVHKAGFFSGQINGDTDENCGFFYGRFDRRDLKRPKIHVTRLILPILPMLVGLVTSSDR